MRTTIVLNPVKLLLDYLENIKIDELYIRKTIRKRYYNKVPPVLTFLYENNKKPWTKFLASACSLATYKDMIR